MLGKLTHLDMFKAQRSMLPCANRADLYRQAAKLEQKIKLLSSIKEKSRYKG